MKVILKQDVKGVGKKGEVKEVATGYARQLSFKKQLGGGGHAGNLKALQATERQKGSRPEELRQSQELAAAGWRKGSVSQGQSGGRRPSVWCDNQ